MIARLQQKFGAIGIVSRGERQPAVLAQRNVMFDPEAKLAGVERTCLGLVVHENAGDVDPHRH